MRTHIHTYACMHIHTNLMFIGIYYICTYTHARIHTYAHVCVGLHIHTLLQIVIDNQNTDAVHAQTNTPPSLYALYIHTHINIYRVYTITKTPCTPRLIRIYMRAHIHTQCTHTHTHTHTYFLLSSSITKTQSAVHAQTNTPRCGCPGRNSQK
jgi:hypothetical protein